MAQYGGSSSIYSPVGFCTTLGGPNKATLIAGGAAAVLGGVLGWYMTRQDETANAAMPLIMGACIGIPVAASTFFQCKGVEIGIPVRK